MSSTTRNIGAKLARNTTHYSLSASFRFSQNSGFHFTFGLCADEDRARNYSYRYDQGLNELQEKIDHSEQEHRRVVNDNLGSCSADARDQVVKTISLCDDKVGVLKNDRLDFQDQLSTQESGNKEDLAAIAKSFSDERNLAGKCITDITSIMVRDANSTLNQEEKARLIACSDNHSEVLRNYQDQCNDILSGSQSSSTDESSKDSNYMAQILEWLNS